MAKAKPKTATTGASSPHLVPVLSPGSVTWRWSIRWREDGRKREKATGLPVEDRAGAERLLGEFLVEWSARQSAAPGAALRPDRITCGQAMTIYAHEHVPGTAAPERIGWALKALAEFWGDVPVSEVRGETCRRYVASRTMERRIPDTDPAEYRTVPIAPATVRRELGVLAAALNYCAKEGHITAAPRVWLPEAPPPKETYLSRQEVAGLVKAARRDRRTRWHLPLFVLVGYYTGRRKDAILSLRWEPNAEGGHVDLDKGVIDFRPVGRAETAKRRGRLQVPARLLRFLRYARQRTEKFVFEYGADGKEPRRIKDVKRSFASAAAAAGLDPTKVTPHVLRHTCLSYLANAGVPLFRAAAWVDLTLDTAEKVYAHHDGRHDDIRDLLDRGGRAGR
ncbi:hypothetical protein CHU95_20155 [Niveispirillum lacus]|uniref:Tyr recombinase domain-containing protein n=1 Tax=Niveispirillum lacus TaxID=1981099 RepID=A0A255YQH9_9PROT|nr:tyrosine-type recombinase/integrase [Niveispirillum lacus]OYQ31467.1 hypothetical protein CHU95_20155 [Niveispirillum lacus]